ncbi:hypothetical protein [Klebsiella pneumoniae IS46]|nr:hypothetical protein [Klebsiella pneumoniae IS46]CDL64850.1 hypothetical protein [Klebsiella pneumoniae IS39]
MDWMMKISPPRTFSLICTLTSPSLKTTYSGVAKRSVQAVGNTLC